MSSFNEKMSAYELNENLCTYEQIALELPHEVNFFQRRHMTNEKDYLKVTLKYVSVPFNLAAVISLFILVTKGYYSTNRAKVET